MPDVALASSKLSRYNHRPTRRHHNAALRVLMYLLTTQEMCISYEPGPFVTLTLIPKNSNIFYSKCPLNRPLRSKDQPSISTGWIIFNDLSPLTFGNSLTPTTKMTSHSRFKIPLNTDSDFTCEIRKQSNLAGLLRETDRQGAASGNGLLWGVDACGRRWSSPRFSNVLKERPKLGWEGRP